MPRTPYPKSNPRQTDTKDPSSVHCTDFKGQLSVFVFPASGFTGLVKFLKPVVCSPCIPLFCFLTGKESMSELTQSCGWQFLKWAIPGFFFFLDNLLAFYVLARLSPVCYHLE